MILPLNCFRKVLTSKVRHWESAVQLSGSCSICTSKKGPSLSKVAARNCSPTFCNLLDSNSPFHPHAPPVEFQKSWCDRHVEGRPTWLEGAAGIGTHDTSAARVWEAPAVLRRSPIKHLPPAQRAPPAVRRLRPHLWQAVVGKEARTAGDVCALAVPEEAVGGTGRRDVRPQAKRGGVERGTGPTGRLPSRTHERSADWT